jgi:hypothetical protein
MGPIGDGADGRVWACSCASSSPAAPEGFEVSPGHGGGAGARLVARRGAWLVAAWRRRPAQLRLAQSPRLPSRKRG